MRIVGKPSLHIPIRELPTIDEEEIGRRATKDRIYGIMRRRGRFTETGRRNIEARRKKQKYGSSLKHATTSHDQEKRNYWNPPGDFENGDTNRWVNSTRSHQMGSRITLLLRETEARKLREEISNLADRAAFLTTRMNDVQLEADELQGDKTIRLVKLLDDCKMLRNALQRLETPGPSKSLTQWAETVNDIPENTNEHGDGTSSNIKKIELCEKELRTTRRTLFLLITNMDALRKRLEKSSGTLKMLNNLQAIKLQSCAEITKRLADSTRRSSKQISEFKISHLAQLRSRMQQRLHGKGLQPAQKWRLACLNELEGTDGYPRLKK